MSQILKFYGQTVEVENGVWITRIYSPIYGTTGCLNQKLIKAAIHAGVKLRVYCGNTVETVNPREWIEKGIKILKEFRIPGKPMTLYMKRVGNSQIDKRNEEIIKESQTRLF